MKENISMASESSEKFSRDATKGTDFFHKIFPTKIQSLPPSKIRLYRPSLDQILVIAGKGEVVEGYVLAMWHGTLGWRCLTCILTGEQFSEEQVDTYMKDSGLVKVGIISSSTSQEPPQNAINKVHGLMKTPGLPEGDPIGILTCATPLLLHIVKGKHQISHKTFQLDAEGNKLEEVCMEPQTRRCTGETFQVLGTGRDFATAGSIASTARQQASWLLKILGNDVQNVVF